MAILGKFVKQPLEILDYEFDFVAWLADRADNINSFTVTAAPETVGASDLTLSNKTTSAGVVRYFAAGGANGVRYKVTCTIVTTGGRTKEAEMLVSIKEA